MKKIIVSAIAAIALVATGCGSMMNNTTTSSNSNRPVLGGLLGALGGSNSTTNSLLNMVIGAFKINESELYGTWGYAAPGCAFTSENLLAKAGGALAAGKVNEKLQPAYNTVGISANNTQFIFSQDGKFQARIAGVPMSGTYTYDKSASAVKMKGTLLTLTGYLTRTNNGMALTFESKKILTLLQAATALSSSNTVKAVGDLSKEFDGVRVGFDLRKSAS